MPPPRPHADPLRCSECLSRASGIFCALDDRALEELERTRVTRRMAKGESLYKEGDRFDVFYCLRAGRAKIFRTAPDGHEYILRIASAGHVLGLETLASDRYARSNAEMLEDGIVCRTDRSVVLELVRRDPTTAVRVIESLAEQVNMGDNDRFAVALLTVRERTARVLLVFTQSHGRPGKKGLLLRLPVSRQTLAEMVAAAPETVMRTIRDLREEGILQGRGKTVHVLDPRRLEDAAGLGSCA